MTTMPVTTSFPEFVPNQILTNTQLNDLREYLDDQNRQTRVRLTGIGIICGLHASIDDSGDDPIVNITNGYGVTSDGYIIEIPDLKFIAKAAYLDPYRVEYNVEELDANVFGPAYEPWRIPDDQIVPSENPITQIAITELLTSQQADENAESENLKLADFTDHVLVLYLELQKQDLKSCLTTDCNNKGQNLKFVVKALLIHNEALPELEACESWTNPAFIPRFHRALRQNNVGTLDQISSSVDINKAYGKIVNDVKSPLFQKIKLTYKKVNPFLQLNIDIDDIKNTWENVLNSIHNQYHYDFVKDIACAYNEFIAHYCTIIADCCPSYDFPRHLMIRDFDGEPEPYRHEFQPSPVRNVMHHDLKKAEILFMRIIEMIQQFGLPQLEEIKITPSQTDCYLLGEKAIPHYYNLSDNVKAYWQGEACCKDPSLLSYAENKMVSADDSDNVIDNAEYISAPLEALIDKKGFLRIEGHLDQDCKTAMDTLVDLRSTHNLDFNLQLLRLGDSEINITESEHLEEIKKLLNDVELIRNEIEQHYFNADIDPDFIKERNDVLTKKWKDIENINEKWLGIRCNTPFQCDLTQIRADYLLIRSRVICTYSKIKKILARLLDIKREDHGFNTDLTAGEVTNQLNKVRARKTELEVNLNVAGLSIEKRNEIELEMATIKSEHSRLVQVETLFKVGTRVSDNLKARSAGTVTNAETAALAVSFNQKNSNIFTQGLVIGLTNLNSDIEKMCAQLPKDGLKFNYCLFIYHYKNVIAGLIQLKLLVGVLLEFIATNLNRNPASSFVLPIYTMHLAAGYLSEITDHMNMINRIQYNCFHAELATSYYTFQHLLLNRGQTFSQFAKKHAGMEHLAGVTRGDTFILVCDEINGSSQVVADFTLSSPIGCCCDLDPENLCLPPIAMPDYKVIRLDGVQETGSTINEVIDVLCNDYNLNGNGKLILSLPSKRSALNALNQQQQPENLSVVDQNGRQQIRYTQMHAPYAIDSFRYQIHQESDCKLMDEGEVIVFIRPDSGRPLITQNDIVATSRGQAINVDVVINDFYEGTVSADPYILNVIGQISQQRGTISVIVPPGQSRQMIEYIPPARFIGRDNFEYEVTVDGKTSRGAVSVLVVPCCDDDNGPIIFETNRKLEGILKSPEGEILPGATVLIVGTSSGTTTSPNGSFSIELPLGRQSVQFEAFGLRSKIFEIDVRDGFDTIQLDVVLQRRNPTLSFDPVGPVDVGFLVDLVLPGEVAEVDNSRMILDTFSTRHTDRVNSIEEFRNDSVVGSTDAFAKADSFINNTMIDANKTIEAISAEYKELTKSLIDAHKLSSGESKTKYKVLIENSTLAFMDKMIIKDPNKAEPTMKAELEKSIVKIKAEGISVKGFKQRFKGSELETKIKINALGEINRILK